VDGAAPAEEERLIVVGILTPRRPAAIARYVAIAAIGLLLVFPLLYLVSLSLMTAHDVVAAPPHLVPPTLRWSNFSEAYSFLSGRTILNSFIFTLGVLLLQLALSLPAGFALAQIPVRGMKFLTALFVIPMFLPSNIAIVPLFIVVFKLHLINTYAGLIIPIAGSTAFGTLLFRQFYVRFPSSLIDAARLDGAGWWRILVSIVMPLSKPAIAAYSAVTFVTAWNMYIWPQIAATDPALRVMPVALAPLARSTYNTIPPSVGFAAAVLTALPVVAAFLLCQRWFLNAIVGTGSVE
jgi:multiple sugar transport system permease protein